MQSGLNGINGKKTQIFWLCKSYILQAKKKRRRCNYYQSVRKYTFFEKSKLPVVAICKFINLWIGNASQKLIMEQCGVFSKQAVTDWASFCREVLLDKMLSNLEPIGGHGKTVEIDESKFGKRK